MIRLLIFGLIISVTLVDVQGPLPIRRIVNGKPAKSSQFPFIAYLQYDTAIFCAATIIHERWALTAGHCYDNELEKDNRRKIHLVIGTNRLNGYDGKHYEVERFIVHPGFRWIEEQMNGGLELLINDIALIRLSRSIYFDDRVKPVFLPSANWYSHEPDWGTILGWGKTDGDSGGPLLVNGIQIGIISTGDSQCGSAKPHLYTRISEHMHWIKKHLYEYNDHI